MKNLLLKVCRRSTGYLSRLWFQITDQRLGRLTPGTYFTKYAIQLQQKEGFSENQSFNRLARGINCLKIAADACYESSGWQMGISLAEWVEEGLSKDAHILGIGWVHTELVSLAKKYGFTSSCREGLSTDQLCRYILDNELILASVSPGFLEDWTRKSTPGGHFVIVHGFEWHQQMCSGFFIYDPDEINQSEKFVPIYTFKKAFSGRAIFVSINKMDYPTQKKNAWVEVDLNAITHNVQEVQRLVGSNVSVIATVKSDAYGHGLVQVSKTLLKKGATMLAVASIDEAVQLRSCGISAPILILYGVPIWEIEQVVTMNLELAIFDLAFARRLSATAREQGKTISVHIKIDTGMGWFGLSPDEEKISDFVNKLHQLPNIRINGIFSHFASSASDRIRARQQLSQFRECLNKLKRNGISPPYIHIANSVAILENLDAYFNAVRPGLLLYGLYPSCENHELVDLQPALEFKTRIIQIRHISPGEPIGYEGTYVPTEPTDVGVLPIGYSDGIPRFLSNQGEVLINGCRAPIVGNVCMNMCMVNVTGIPNVQVGDEVVVIGRQGEERISASDIARLGNTISYEILTNIANHIPRITTSGDQNAH